MNHARKEVITLLGLLSEEMWARAKEGKFSLFDHVLKPGDYCPTTESEKVIWKELTRPSLHAELVRYLQPAIEAGDPDSAFYQILLKDSAERVRSDSNGIGSASAPNGEAKNTGRQAEPSAAADRPGE